jgi:hypothetical protein
MLARGLHYSERAVDIRPVIWPRHLDRGDNVGARREMEDAIDSCADFIDGRAIGYISVDDRHARIVEMTLEIRSATDREIIDNPNLTAGLDQAIDKMAANEASTSCNKIDLVQTRHNLMSTVG